MPRGKGEELSQAIAGYQSCTWLLKSGVVITSHQTMPAHGTSCLSPVTAQVCADQTCCDTKHREIQLPGGAEPGSALPCASCYGFNYCQWQHCPQTESSQRLWWRGGRCDAHRSSCLAVIKSKLQVSEDKCQPIPPPCSTRCLRAENNNNNNSVNGCFFILATWLPNFG